MKRIVVLIMFVSCLFSRTVTTAVTGRWFQILRHNKNNVELCISNYGTFGRDETGNNPGLWWPAGTPHTYSYGAGLWVGAQDSVGGDTMVTIGYGPGGGESEFAPGLCGMSVSHPEAIIYMYPNPWPPPATTFPMAPQEPVSDQDSWCCYNDCDSIYHMPGDARGIGIEVYQTVYIWNLSLLRDIVYIIYEIKNVRGQHMKDFYVGICTDNDIGDEGAQANDRMSGIVGQWYVIDGDSLYIDNLAFQWQEVEEPGTPPWWTGVIGHDLIRTPYDLVENEDKDNDGILDQYETDSAYYANSLPLSKWDTDHDGVPDWRDASQIPQLGMTALKRFTLGVEPTYDRERYLTLAGFNFRTLVWEPYDTVAPAPDDQRWLQCSGPFDLMPDSTVTMVLGLVLAEWHDIYMKPDTALVLVDYWAQFCHDMNWFVPGPPPAPGLALIPGDAKVTLVWDKQPELSADPWFNIVGVDTASPFFDPYYRQCDFEGYRVWKSISGHAGTWELLASCDLSDGIVFEDTTQPDSIRLRAEDTGIFHVFTDDDVRNGFAYHYAVTSFDWNQVKSISGPDTFPRAVWFESGLSGDSVQPRRDPANYVAGSYEVTSLVGNEALADMVSASMSSPLDMTSDNQYVDFSPIVYADGLARYTADLLDAAYVSQGSVTAALAGGGSVVNDYVVFQGMNVVVEFARPELVPTSVIFDSVMRVSGDYPVDSLVAPAPMGGTGGYGLWAYRGNDYEVHWMASTPGDLVNTVVVLDAFSGDTIPYAPFAENAATDSLANSWSFHSTGPGFSDTLIYDAPGPPRLGTKYLYICGGKVNLKNGLELVTGDARPADGEVWHVYASATIDPVPAYGRVQITPTPAYFDMEPIDELNVKVVPNPYIIANEWQTRSIRRRLKFINLPNRCTIRIFNLNGELVRTLLHTDTSEDGVTNNLGGDEWWNCLGEYNQLLASGVYIFHIDSEISEQVGKFVIID
jgi:hypothetical protein